MDDPTSFSAQAGPPSVRPAPGPQHLWDRAEQAFAAGRNAEAAPLYRHLLAAHFLPGLQLYRLATIANRERDFDAAWRLHRHALQADPLLASRITHPSTPHHRVVCRPSYDTEDVPRCPVCGNSEQEPLMVVNCLPFSHYHPCFDPVRRWVRCIACGHGFANPRPAPAALREALAEPPPPHLLQWTYDRLLVAAEVVHRLWERRPGGDLLDVGAGGGALSGAAADYSYRVCALDLHPGYRERLERLGAEFIVGDICTHNFGVRRFDVLLLGDVIEHLADPRQAFARVASVLKPGGLVWLSTPDCGGAWTRVMGDADPMWLEGEHLQFFCQRSLRRLVADQGFAVADYRLSRRFVGCMEVVLIQGTPPG